MLLCLAVVAGCSRNPAIDPRPTAPASQASAESGALAGLGRALFFDTSLSDPPGQACASCHDPSWAFATPRNRMQAGMAPGADPSRFGMRNAPTLMYASFIPPRHVDPVRGTLVGGLMHDQRADSLEDHALRPFFNPAEMANASPPALLARLRRASYAAQFDRVFGRGALSDPGRAMQHLAAAVAAYQRTEEFSPFSSKFDAVMEGRATFDASEARGYEAFRDRNRGNCVECHSLGAEQGRRALFTDFSSHNLGLPPNRSSPFYRMPTPINPDGARFIDLGVARDPQRAGMEGRFRVPTLRNVAITSPYMHNGVFASLGEAVRFYTTGCVPGNPDGWAEPEVASGRECRKVGRLKLTARDTADLVNFMYTLTDGWYDPATGLPGPMQVAPMPPSLGGAGRSAIQQH
ncbi:MAG: cytochrome c peroxidase [Pseudomonadota bacterium]